MHYWFYGGHMIWMTISWLVGIGLFSLFIWLVASAIGRGPESTGSPEDVLRRRYAGGKIEMEEVAPNDGTSLVPWIDDPQTRKDPGPVFAEYALPSRNAKTMIRDGAWKYTCWAHDIPELYNLESDPDELHNVAAEPQHAAKAAELRSRLLAWNPIT